MKVLLGIAPWRFDDIYPPAMARRAGFGTQFGLIGGAPEPLGLLYLAATLKRAGHRVMFLDGIFASRRDFLDTIERDRPDLVGFSVMTFGWDETKALAGEIKRLHPSLPIVAGGAHINAVPLQAMEDCPALDYGLAGPGEHAIVELCDRLEAGRPVAGLRGLFWRDDGDLVAEPPAPRPPDLDTTPYPDRSLVDLNAYCPSVGFYKARPSTSMITTTGCANQCTFCHAYRRMQVRSVENVMGEIEQCVREYGVRHIVFWDESLTYDRDRLMRLCRALIRSRLRVWWCGNARVDQVDRDLLETARRAGCWKLLLGCESGVQRHLDAVGKNFTLEDVRRGVALVHDAGIQAFGTFMFGIPGETFEDGLRTIDFACSLKLDYAAFLNFCPWPGSHIYRNCRQYGTHLDRWSLQKVCFVPHSMTLEAMCRLKELAFRRFYMRPRYLLQKMLTIRSLEDVRRYSRGYMAYRRVKASEFKENRGQENRGHKLEIYVPGFPGFPLTHAPPTSGSPCSHP